MLNLKKFFTILGVASLTAACGTTVGTAGDATDDTSSDATVGDDSMGDMVMGDTTMGDTTAAPVYTYLVIYDSEKPDCSTNGPGADIDAIQLERGGSVVGVGLIGSSDYAASNPNSVGTCTMCGKNADKPCSHGGDQCSCADSAMGAPDAKLYCGATVDVGYVSLNGGSLQFAFGDATGAGTAVALKSGDKIKVWEVDETFTHVDNETCAKPLAEKYEVWARTAKGVDMGSIKLVTSAGADGNGVTEFVVP